jgi:hypothetical protein
MRDRNETDGERWLSTGVVAAVLGCHAQTVRDRCARGELRFSVDPETGHRRIAAADVEALGYAVPAATGRRATRRKFEASITADIEAAVLEGAAEHLADHVLMSLAERDGALLAAGARLGRTQAALDELARARFWQRRRVLAKLRTEGLIKIEEGAAR